MGHALGSPDSRTAPPAPERSLSPPAVCIMRALMHSALLWCSCHYQDTVAAELAALVKPPVNPNNLPEFFWMHLRKDIEQLSRVTGKGLDESAIIIHLVLHGILTRPLPTSKNKIHPLTVSSSIFPADRWCYCYCKLSECKKCKRALGEGVQHPLHPTYSRGLGCSGQQSHGPGG